MNRTPGWVVGSDGGGAKPPALRQGIPFKNSAPIASWIDNVPSRRRSDQVVHRFGQGVETMIEEGAKSTASLVPEIYYDLIARIPVGLLLALALAYRFDVLPSAKTLKDLPATQASVAAVA